jgi:hypothetical protein
MTGAILIKNLLAYFRITVREGGPGRNDKCCGSRK